MSRYPDASLIVSAATTEVSSEAARAWLRTTAVDLAFSTWCLTEFAGAIAAKSRAGVLAPDVATRLFVEVPRLLQTSGWEISVQRRHFTSAAQLLARATVSLRAGDALHLAIASTAGATLWTLDRRMAAAGQALGLAVELLR